eukprot:scaffold1033_cov205-Alexandrium_tamarense.AAC.11
MYGDQELRVSAVDSLRESVRRALLQKPSLTPYFLELALLDSLSYDIETNEGGPDGSVIKAVLSSKEDSAHVKSLQECALVLVEAKKNLKKLSSITIADAVALAGAEAVNAVGGPATPEGDWKASKKPKFREAGKIGRMSEFKALSDEDIANELAKDSEEDEGESYTVDGDDGWYIADTFGTQKDRFGQNVANGNGDANNFSSTLKNLQKEKQGGTQYAWIREFLLSKGEFAGCFTFCGLSPPLFALLARLSRRLLSLSTHSQHIIPSSSTPTPIRPPHRSNMGYQIRIQALGV